MEAAKPSPGECYRDRAGREHEVLMILRTGAVVTSQIETTRSVATVHRLEDVATWNLLGEGR